MLLKTQVLVLNKFFSPAKITIAREALSALFKDRAHVVDDKYNSHTLEQWIVHCSLIDKNPAESLKYAGKIFSPSLSLYIPRVIRIPSNTRNPSSPIVRYSRHNIYKRDGNICQYCSKYCKTNMKTLDHVIPKSKGGKNTWQNVVTCCRICNSKKGNKTLSELGWKLINKPIAPKWTLQIKTSANQIQNQYWKNFI